MNKNEFFVQVESGIRNGGIKIGLIQPKLNLAYLFYTENSRMVWLSIKMTE